jgi:hypothetical protein
MLAIRLGTNKAVEQATGYDLTKLLMHKAPRRKGRNKNNKILGWIG